MHKKLVEKTARQMLIDMGGKDEERIIYQYNTIFQRQITVQKFVILRLYGSNYIRGINPIKDEALEIVVTRVTKIVG